jgi:quinone-modifying oxidoreductase subunit QmoC
MSNTVRVQPDLKFVKELQQFGGESLKKCYQCATCSVVCPLSPADNPYPRKEMVWAQWGLKDRLLNDIDIWLCHNCGTCSDLCPRGAKPGDLLGALRNMAYKNLAQPNFIGKFMSGKGLPVLILIPALIYLFIWIVRAGILGTAFPLFEMNGHDLVVSKTGQIIYGGLFPGDYTIDPIFAVLALFMLFGFYSGVSNLIKSFASMPRTFIVGRKKEPSFLCSLIETIRYEVAQHTQFQDCGADEKSKKRFKGHLLTMYAFVCLFVVTTIVAVGHWGGAFLMQKVLGLTDPLTQLITLAGSTPMPLYSPVKILANVGAIMLVLGLTFLTSRRASLDKAKQGSSFDDWYLLTLIWVIALSGLGSELFRLSGLATIAYPTYYVHIVAVFMLVAYLPWSKLAHLVYRTVALAYARKIGRIPMQPVQH